MIVEFLVIYVVGILVGFMVCLFLQELVDFLMSVRWFGVKGDGVIDDMVVFQVVFNVGILLYFLMGIYLYSNMLKVMVLIVGVGWDLIL